MNLKTFDVHSYRSCQSVKFPLNRDLTGLIGINGSGKTNVLNSIFLLRKISEFRFKYANNRDTEYNTCKIGAVFEHNGISIQLKATIYLEMDERNNDEIISSDFKWKFSNYNSKEWLTIPIEFFSNQFNSSSFHLPVSIRSNIRFSKGSRGSFFEIYKLFHTKEFKKNVQPLLHEVFEFINGINYYSATQFSDPGRCPVSIELEEDRFRRRTHSSSGHEQFIFDLYNSHKQNDKEFIRYFNTIGKVGIGLIDELSFETLPIPSSTYKVRSGGQIKQKNFERQLIVPIFTINGKKLSPNQLSEGTFKTLALLYYLITDKSTLLLIEEPEVCIHHGLLDSIIKLLISQSKHKQIIISTHSDFVLDHLSPENILLVKYLETKGTTVKQLSKSMSSDEYRALKMYLKESGNLGEYAREGGFEYE
ncbi:MAG: ATP-binding protein [Candidatus Moranbacteria bacterium]|nr:ATP-binding protein [Candidatus Moranbacteria bacterium]